MTLAKVTKAGPQVCKGSGVVYTKRGALLCRCQLCLLEQALEYQDPLTKYRPFEDSGRVVRKIRGTK